MQSFALVATIGAIIAMAVGSFLVHDGYPHHDFVGHIGEGLGFLALGLNFYLRDKAMRQQAHDWGLVSEGLLLGAAYLAGWGLARLTKRRPAAAAH